MLEDKLIEKSKVSQSREVYNQIAMIFYMTWELMKIILKVMVKSNRTISLENLFYFKLAVKLSLKKKIFLMDTEIFPEFQQAIWHDSR